MLALVVTFTTEDGCSRSWRSSEYMFAETSMRICGTKPAEASSCMDLRGREKDELRW
jgi:hypothetical protein